MTIHTSTESERLTAAHSDERVHDELLELLQRAFDHARAGDAGALEGLLDLGVPVGLANDKGDTLLMLAAYHGHKDTAAMLLRRGASPEQANDRGQTPLAGVCFKGDLNLATLLLDSGADVDGASADGKTPLMFAAMFDQLAVLQLLLARGADKDAQTESGATASSLAQQMGAARAAARLVEDERHSTDGS